MTKCILSVLAVMALAGLMAGFAEDRPAGSSAYLAEIKKVEDWSKDFDSDLMAQARAAGYDLGKVFSKAMQGDNDALHEALLVAGLVDGAASESYIYSLTYLLRAMGDVRFGEQLALETPETRESVHMLLGCGLTGSMGPADEQLQVVRSHYPITFQQNDKHARF
jgi:hypothetical protein